MVQILYSLGENKVMYVRNNMKEEMEGESST